MVGTVLDRGQDLAVGRAVEAELVRDDAQGARHPVGEGRISTEPNAARPGGSWLSGRWRLSRAGIDVWGHPAEAGLSARASRTIDTHVSSIRSKLRETGWILTGRGVGFRFRQE
ncbi:winged helix-turn-helix domain-containing protein [Streptomyces sp. M2CJ-2]|nr:winged helix-turn-helix domain-containing protein [Streptomyces sp. M2CJ-2]